MPTPAEQPSNGHPIIDRTGTSLGGGDFRVGAPCHPAYGHGACLVAQRDSTGWTIRRSQHPRHTELARVLLAYLTGPRRVRLTIWRLDSTAFTDVDLTSHEVLVQGGPDPDDEQAWQAWLIAAGSAWLAAHAADEHGRFHLLASDLDAALLSGYQGLWPLASADLTL